MGSLLVVLLLTGAQAFAAPDAPDFACESAEACFRNAVSFADAHPGQAISQAQGFRRVREAHPETIWARRAGFRLGWSLLDHDPVQALEYLRTARKDFPLLEDYAVVKIGQALGRLGSFHESAMTFDAVPALSPPSVLNDATLYEAGFAWFEEGHCCHAADRLRQATSRDRDAPSAPRAFHVLATCTDRLQRVTDARRALREIWVNYPESPEAQTVNHSVRSGHPSLRWEPSSGDYYRRAKTFYGLARFEKAIRDLQTFLAGRPGSPGREQGLFQLGMAHVRLKQYPQAEPIFRQLADMPSAYTGKAAVWLARVYLRQDQGQLLMQFRDADTPGLRMAERVKIQWLSGVWAEDNNAMQEAVTAYAAVSRSAGPPAIRRRALWRLGWLHYQQGAWEDARDRFHDLAATARDHGWQSRARYWKARALERMGRKDEAHTWYRRVATERPMTYYGQLAQSRLRIPLTAEPETRVQWKEPESAGSASSGLQDNVHFQKAKELSALGLREEAVGELASLQTHYRGQPQRLYALARSMMEYGAYDAALLIARRHFPDALERHQVPHDSPLWKMAYPTGYVRAIRGYADPHVDPFLVAGIIREESLYNPRALSPVGAAGLMQFMPKTANRVARRLGLGSVDREDLFEGEVNVRLGVSYVGELLHTYQGNQIHAIAAYNAGPDAVKRWIARFGERDPDEFVELISYKETRRYVKRVITSSRIYHHLYSTVCSAFRLDTAC